MSALTLTKVLTTKGYAYRKDALTEEQQRQIRRDLTVTPQTQGPSSFAPAAKPFSVYFESQQRLYLPRHWARDKFGLEEASIVPEGNDLPAHVSFTGKPFDYQTAIIEQFLQADANGLICVPCGKGKTFMALCIAARLRKRFLVLVDKEFLLNQWKGEIEAFFPGLRIGVLRASKCETDPAYYDVTLCMIQSLVQKEYPEDTFKTYGFAIFDECHHLGAQHFSRALLKIQVRHMLGLSATPERDDGLTKVFEWYLGKPVYWEKVREADTTVSVRAMYYQSDGDQSYENVPTNYRGETEATKLLGQIMDYAPRNQWIAEALVDLVKDSRRRVLILSQYKRHLEAFEDLLKALSPQTTYSYYVGGMKEEVREKGAQTSQVLLGSYAMASEAMNIKTLNAVILASPRKKIEQSVGRILRQRPHERQVNPLIIDVVDSHGTFRRQFVKRRAFYIQCGYKIERIFKKQETEDQEGVDGAESGDSDSDTETETPSKVAKKKAAKKPTGGKLTIQDFALVDD